MECDTDLPVCVEFLVVLNKGGCWGCGFLLTCICSDGIMFDCKKQIFICPEGVEMVVQEGCPVCVTQTGQSSCTVISVFSGQMGICFL